MDMEKPKEDGGELRVLVCGNHEEEDYTERKAYAYDGKGKENL